MYITIVSSILLFRVFIYSNSYFDQKKVDAIFLIFFCSLLFFAMAFRNVSVGYDTLRYKELFEICANSSLHQLIDSPLFNYRIGYAFLMHFCGIFSSNYYVFQFVISAIIMVGFYFFIKNNCSNIFLSCCVFLGCGIYLSAYNVTREIAAVAIIINAWNTVYKRKYLHSILLMLISISFHLSSVVFVAGVLLSFLFNKYNWILAISPVFIVLMYLFYNQIIDFFSHYITMYSTYFTNRRELRSVNLGWIVWVIIVVASLWVMYFLPGISSPKKTMAFFSLFAIGTKFISLYFNYFDRIGTFFIPFEVLVFDTIITATPKKILVYGVELFYLSFFLLTGLTSEQYLYKSYLW